MFDLFTSEALGALATLTFLEIVLGIDNLLFISIASGHLEGNERKKATRLGLILAMLLRIALLFGVAWMANLNSVLYSFSFSWVQGDITGQSLIFILGGIFLLYKSTTEIHEKLEGEKIETKGSKKGLVSVIIQITLINVVFSIDSILTAVGMTNGLDNSLIIMIIAVIISVLIMVLFANMVNDFVKKHPTIQMLGLSFLILVSFMLIAEGAHKADMAIFDQKVGLIPKGYLYFAITFSLVTEFLNMRLRKKKN